MSLAQKYRNRFAAQRSDRLALYFATAVVLHLGAIVAATSFLKALEASLPEEPEVTPIEFVYIEPSPQPTPAAIASTERRSATQSSAAGPESSSNAPVNAGKPELPAAKPVTEAARKPIDNVAAAPSGMVPISSPTKAVSEPVISKGTRAPVPVVPPLPQVRPVPSPKPSVSNPASPPVVSSLDDLPVLTPTEVDPLVLEGAVPAGTQVASTEIQPMLPSQIQGQEEQPFPNAAAQLPPIPPEATWATPVPSLTEPSAAEPPAPEDASIEPDPFPSGGNNGTGLDGLPNSDQVARGPVQISAMDDEILGDYMNALNRKIDQHWRQVPVNMIRQPRVWFVIDRQGGLVDLGLSHPSGSEEADQAALEAIQTAAPFDPLPVQYANDLLRINFTFTYNIDLPEATQSEPPVPNSP